MQLFGKKKPQQDTSRTTAANNRDSNNLIADKLQAASRAAGAMGEEFVKLTEMLRMSARNADPVSANDASGIDALLSTVIDQYKAGLENRHEETAREGYNIIKTGLDMRKKLQRCSAEEKAMNEEKLGLWSTYLQMVEAQANNLYEMEKQEIECAKLEEALNEKYENILEETKTNPAWKTLKSLRPSDTAPADAQKLAIKIKEYIMNGNLYLVAGSKYLDTQKLVSSEAVAIQAMKSELESNLQLVDGSGAVKKVFEMRQEQSRSVREKVQETGDIIKDASDWVEVDAAEATGSIINDLRVFQAEMQKKINEREEAAKMKEERERERENEKQQQLLN